jgi:mono/diheme cytochrome c family protein
MIHYHVIGTGDLSAVEYEKEINPQWVETTSASEFSIGYKSPFYKSGEELTPLSRIQIALAQEKEAALLAAQNMEAAGAINVEDIGFNDIIQAAMRVANPAELTKLQNAFPDIYAAFQAGSSGTAGTAEGVPAEMIEPLTDASSLSAGESIFITNCATCHGKLGEGGIGPNMTDDYFIHGPSMNDKIKVINTGVPAKGMISWRGILNEDQIKQVASYIVTLRGTNPPNAKAPQGNKAE